jgi:hypothetical protein
MKQSYISLQEYESIRIQSYTKNSMHFNLNFVLNSVLPEGHFKSFIFNSEAIFRFSPSKIVFI